jgi:hypothetical protein
VALVVPSRQRSISAGEGLSARSADQRTRGISAATPGAAKPMHEGWEYTGAKKLAIVFQIYEAVVHDKMARA